MSIRRYNLKFLIVVFVILFGVSHSVVADHHTDLFAQKIEVKTSTKKKKVKRQKSIQQSISLLQEHLPQYGNDILERVNTNKEPHRMFEFVNTSNTIIPEGLFSAFSFRINLIQNIWSWLGTPYRFGGKGTHGIDCSGFTSTVINETVGQNVLKGSSRNQVSQVKKIFCKDSLQFGDLIFFAKTKISKKINHVAIYLGDNLFAHSSTHHGVIVSEFDSNYFSRYRFGGRLPYQWSYASVH